MAAKKKLRVGLIGCGRFAVPGHAVYYRANPRSDFVAVCDVKEENAEKLAGRFGVKNTFSDYIKMLDEAELDAVSICTPTFTHADITRAAAERGVNILCEKPFAISPEEGRAMIDVCKENNVLLHTGFNKRYDIGIEKARRLVQEGRYGKCFHAEIKWHGLPSFGSIPAVSNVMKLLEDMGLDSESTSPEWRLSDPRIPGGVLEVFCHIVDIALWIFGPPDEIHGSAFRVSDEAQKPEHAAVIFKYQSGPTVFLNMSTKTLSFKESDSGLFECAEGNIRYETHMTRHTFLPARLTLESRAGFFGKRADITPSLFRSPLEILPMYRRIDTFLADVAGGLPEEMQDVVPRGEAGLAVDEIIQEVLRQSSV